jgi:hypothetical protein
VIWAWGRRESRRGREHPQKRRGRKGEREADEADRPSQRARGERRLARRRGVGGGGRSVEAKLGCSHGWTIGWGRGDAWGVRVRASDG